MLRAAVLGQPQIVTAAELERRRVLAYPPFGALAELTGDDPALVAIAAALREQGVNVYGPSDGRALVHATDWDVLADALADAMAAGRALGRARAVVDPPRV